MTDQTEEEMTAYIERVLTTAVYTREDGEIFATVPELPGVWAVGATETTAAAELRVAVAGAWYLQQA